MEFYLIVVERIEQAKHHRRAGTDPLQEVRQPVRHRLFYLVAGETTRHENLLQELVRIEPATACELRQQMDVELVAAIHHRDFCSLRNGVRRHGQ